MLADYFGVSPMELVADDIVGRSAPLSEENEKSPAPSAGTEDIMKIYSMLTPDRQKQLRSALADLLKEQLQD